MKLKTLLIGMSAALLSMTSAIAHSTPIFWTSSFGAALVSGDDAIVPTNLNGGFNMNGQTFTSAFVSTNGFVQFGGNNGNGCCQGDLAQSLSGYPRISPQWFDNVGTVYQNNSTAGRTVFTWSTYEYGQSSSPNYTTQLTLLDDGRFAFGFNGTGVPISHTTLIGVTPGGGVADPGASDLSTYTAQTATGSTVYQLFSPNTFDMNNQNLFFTPTGNGYSVSTQGFGVSAAPDPATWLTMILGFGLIGMAQRRASPARRKGVRAWGVDAAPVQAA